MGKAQSSVLSRVRGTGRRDRKNTKPVKLLCMIAQRLINAIIGLLKPIEGTTS